MPSLLLQIVLFLHAWSLPLFILIFGGSIFYKLYYLPSIPGCSSGAFPLLVYIVSELSRLYFASRGHRNSTPGPLLAGLILSSGPLLIMWYVRSFQCFVLKVEDYSSLVIMVAVLIEVILLILAYLKVQKAKKI
ncbi:hypothetical protein P9112_005339 [Eukaryota sp. TZLM1-RC]